MEQRLSLVTLGVADVPAARAFYEALGWSCDTDPSLDVAFFQLGALVLAAGATIGRPGAKTFWGGYSGVFVDPDGHPWEVAHNPHWTIGDDGSVRI